MSYMIIVYKHHVQPSKNFLCTPPYGMNSVLNFVYPTLWLPMITYANHYMSDYKGEMVLFPML